LEGKQGITKLYYEDGNQVLNGIIKEDCDDGQTKTETQLKNGLIEEVRFYNLEGKLEAVETYVNGLEDSFRWAK
jgi:antitoxin component YwqK of YwqJK toxin-antitoxin module